MMPGVRWRPDAIDDQGAVRHVIKPSGDTFDATLMHKHVGLIQDAVCATRPDGRLAEHDPFGLRRRGDDAKRAEGVVHRETRRKIGRLA